MKRQRKRATGSPRQPKPPRPGRPRSAKPARKDPKHGTGGARSRGESSRTADSAAALPALRWWTPWLSGLGALVWLLALTNAAVPMVRCEAGWADKGLFLLAMLLPWQWLRLVPRAATTRWKVIFAAAAVIAGVAGPWFAWRHGAWSVQRKEISSVVLPAGGRVVAREERDPGSPRYRMVVRQEREWFRGVSVVRQLASHPDAHGGLVELLDGDTVRIRPARVIGEVPSIVRDLKPWCWW